MSCTSFHRASKIAIQCFVYFQLAKCTHTSDGKRIFLFLNLVQTKSRQINCCLHISVAHLQPEHPPIIAFDFFWIQFICLFKACYFYIIFWRETTIFPFLFVILCFFTQSDILSYLDDLFQTEPLHILHRSFRYSPPLSLSDHKPLRQTLSLLRA